MAIKKYFATADTTILNAFKANLSTTGKLANMGESDILEMFSIYAQATTTSVEKARILVKFPFDEILKSRQAGKIPASGSARFFFNLYNAKHSQTLPKKFYVTAQPIPQEWEEGYGMDMESFTNEGAANWLSASTGVSWAAQGGMPISSSYINSPPSDILQYIDKGTEDVRMDITGLAENWLIGEAATPTFTTASAQIVFSNVPSAGTLIKIHSHTGLARIYRFSNTGTTGQVTGSWTTVQRVNGNLNTTLTYFLHALGGTSGHGGQLVASKATLDAGGGTAILLTQSLGGYSGNTKISSSTAPAPNLTHPTHFAGGSGLKNYGLMLKLEDTYESGSILKESIYTKKFFARGTQFFFKRPSIEVLWDDSKLDNRPDTTFSSSAVPAKDNLNSLYFYNKVRGELKNIPGLSKSASGKGLLDVRFYSKIGGNPKTVLDAVDHDLKTVVSASQISTGVYTASFAITGSETRLYDVWSTGSGNSRINFFTGSFVPKKQSEFDYLYDSPLFVNKITNMKHQYTPTETARFRVFTRRKNWSPNIYTKVSAAPKSDIVPEGYYSIRRTADDLIVFPYTTGSLKYGRMSYDVSGSYFDIDMSILEPRYAYEIRLLYKMGNDYKVQEEKFKFRVEP